jgi:hypothetical protein
LYLTEIFCPSARTIEIKCYENSEQYQHHDDAKEATDEMLDEKQRYDDGEYRYDV